jgi:hypothetical protein
MAKAMLLALCGVLASCGVEVLMMPTAGMRPTIGVGEQVGVNFGACEKQDPELGDLVVFRPFGHPGRRWVSGSAAPR